MTCIDVASFCLEASAAASAFANSALAAAACSAAGQREAAFEFVERLAAARALERQDVINDPKPDLATAIAFVEALHFFQCCPPCCLPRRVRLSGRHDESAEASHHVG